MDFWVFIFCFRPLAQQSTQLFCFHLVLISVSLCKPSVHLHALLKNFDRVANGNIGQFCPSTTAWNYQYYRDTERTLGKKKTVQRTRTWVKLILKIGTFRLKGHCHGDLAELWYKLRKYLTKSLFSSTKLLLVRAHEKNTEWFHWGRIHHYKFFCVISLKNTARTWKIPPIFSSCTHLHPNHPQTKIIYTSFCALIGLLLTKLNNYFNNPPIQIYCLAIQRDTENRSQ